MINLDQRYHHYLRGDRKFRIDGIEETVRGYGFSCDGLEIIGYYVLTEKHKLHYDLNENFKYMEDI
jgi:hypothetical protein